MYHFKLILAPCVHSLVEHDYVQGQLISIAQAEALMLKGSTRKTSSVVGVFVTGGRA